MRNTAFYSLIMALLIAPALWAETLPDRETGQSASEMLAGNGTYAGYALGHGNVMPDSEVIYVGSRRATRDQDYAIDYASGTLFFVNPVSATDWVSVDYHYADTPQGGTEATAPGSDAPDVLNSGTNSIFALGTSPKITGILGIEGPPFLSRRPLADSRLPTNRQQSNMLEDRLVVQNAELALGTFRLKLGYQDVSKDFSGFASLRDSKPASADLLKQLEKEKGIRRMNIAGELPTGTDGKISFALGQIKESRDDILTRWFGYAGSRIRINYSMREVGKDFIRFRDLRDAERARLAAEAGMRRSNYGLQFRTTLAADGKPIWSGFNVTQLEGKTGALTYKTADLEFSKAKIYAGVRQMDPTFNRMAALTDEERSRMALLVRRQFDPQAQLSNVTAQDKAQIVGEAGLDRATYVLQVGGGPVNTWVSLSSIDSAQGGLTRRSINLNTSWFSAYFNRQSIDPTFTRLTSLQPIEQAHFGNEFGMMRTELGGTLKLAGGEAAFSRRSVTDSAGANLLRQSIDFKSSRLKFHANLQDIDPHFTRIADLADADRALLLLEGAGRRSDYWINFQATPALAIDAYIFDSDNAIGGRTKSRNRYRIDYAPGQSKKITLFLDDYTYVSPTGKLVRHTRNRFACDNKFNLFGGLTFRMLSNVSTQQTSVTDPLTIAVDQYRIESDQNARTSFVLDSIRTDYSDGRRENTHAVQFKMKAFKSLSLIGSYAKTDYASQKPEANSRFGLEWAVKKDLTLRFDVNNRDGGPIGDQQVHQFSLSGVLAKKLLFFDDVKINYGTNDTALQGKQIGCDNGFRLEAGFLGGKVLYDNSDKLDPSTGIYSRSRIFQYESDKDPKKRYHLTYSRQNLITALGQPAEKRNCALDVRFSPKTSLTLTSYYGKDTSTGVVLPVGGTVVKLSHGMTNGLTLIADYSDNVNGITHRRARVAGLGFHGTLSNNAAVELYYGWCLLDDGGGPVSKPIFRIGYEHRVGPSHFISLTAERKSGIEKGSIDSYEGDTIARLDFRTEFN